MRSRSKYLALFFLLPAGAIAAPPGFSTLSTPAKKCLDVHWPDYQGMKDGGRVQVWDCNDGDHQMWKMEGGRVVTPNGLCLDYAWPDREKDGCVVQTLPCNAGPNQTFTRDGDRLVTPNGKCLDVHGPAAATNGGRIQLWSCNGGDNQRWFSRAEPKPTLAATDIPGLYDAVNPSWQDTLTVSADGKIRRGKGHSGTWSLAGTTVTLAWASGRPTILKLSTPGKFEDSSGFSITKRPAPAWLAGDYDAVHSAWRDIVSIGAEGGFRRANGDAGKWTFDGKTLALHWANGALDVTALKSEGAFVIKGFNLTKRPVTVITSIPVTPGRVPAEIPGVYDGAHPHWGDAVIISANGRYQRGNGDPGSWTFDGTTLTLTWDNWGPEPVKVAGAGKFSNGSFTITKRPPPAWLIGTYQGSHSHWGDSVTLAADGTYKRGNGDGGKWSFDGTTLVLHWTVWGDEAVTLQSEGRFANNNGFSLAKR